MSIYDYLRERKVEFDLIPHRDTYDAQHMAAALHVSGRTVAKTVLLRVDSGYTYIVVVLPANKNVDMELASRMLGGSKLELAMEVEISRHCPDCEVGALPPFGSQYGMKTLLDESLAENDSIIFEGNTHHEAIRMSFEDFCQIEQPLIGELSK